MRYVQYLPHITEVCHRHTAGQILNVLSVIPAVLYLNVAISREWLLDITYRSLYNVFEKYNLGDKAMLCLWVNGQLNTAIRERPRILELQDRLKEWLQEL